jgi:HSP20 family protein
MTLIKRNGTSFPSLFSDFFDTEKFFSPEFFSSKELSKWTPSVNITENDKQYNIELAAPGLTKEDFKIDVEDDVLTISAEKNEEKKEEGERFTRREFSYGSFSRSFSLPEHVKAENIQGKYEDGILKLILTKTEVVTKKDRKEIKLS